MGQRLNLEIANEDKVLANAYYHWSGYTSSALKIARSAVEHLKEGKAKTPLILAVEALNKTGATLTEDEYKAIGKLDVAGKIFLKPDYVDRNMGLIAVSEEGKKETKHWQEQGIQIDLDKRVVHTHQAFWTMSAEEYEEDYEAKVSELPVLDIDLDDISFDDFEEFVSKVDANHTWYCKSEDLVYSWVE